MLNVRCLVMLSFVALLMGGAFSLKGFDGKDETLAELVSVQARSQIPANAKAYSSPTVDTFSLGEPLTEGDRLQDKNSLIGVNDFAGQLTMQVGSAASKENFLQSMGLLEQWAKYDLMEVFAWLERQDTQEMASFYQAIVLSALLDPLSDKQQLAYLIAKLPQDLTNHSFLITTFANELAKQDINLALEWLETVELESSASHAKSSVLTQWAQLQPNLALDFLLEQPELEPSLTQQVAVNAISAMSTQELTRHIEHLYRYPEALQLSISGALVRTMLARQPTLAKQWIDEQARGPIKDASLQEYIRHQASYMDNGELRELILEVEDSNLSKTLWALVASE
ncbi:hypothetical protein [Agarivorans sp. Alg241-V36]|uniref:hypothetical protein n=1 Tax=Agarivorans sp. Alg241-V36 TaxID=2305992 RepID=UPI0013D13D0C|nr:hypothetical protein [Agarivorans sp. Alg241-V36]